MLDKDEKTDLSAAMATGGFIPAESAYVVGERDLPCFLMASTVERLPTIREAIDLARAKPKPAGANP